MTKASLYRTEVKEMEHRYIPMEKMETREEGTDLYIEGYFAVFNSIYELWPGATESIAPGEIGRAHV